VGCGIRALHALVAELSLGALEVTRVERVAERCLESGGLADQFGKIMSQFIDQLFFEFRPTNVFKRGAQGEQ
jgi:hypothetical protein